VVAPADAGFDGVELDYLTHSDDHQLGCPIQSASKVVNVEEDQPAGQEDERRITRRGRETRQRIVSAAAVLMFEHGVAETTLEDIRAAAEVSGSQVYHYFDDKQALVRAVIDYQTDAVLDSQSDHLDALDTMAGLRAWRDFIVEHQRQLQCRGGCPIGALGAEVAETDSAARMAVAGGMRRWEQRIRDGLRTMQTQGDLPQSVDTEDLALALLAALQGGLLLTQIQRDTKPLEVALDAMLDRIEALAIGEYRASHAGGPGRNEQELPRLNSNPTR
jgi:TetR/AcrR family transcriptional regulator, transcriptional repressor for nem operon